MAADASPKAAREFSVVYIGGEGDPLAASTVPLVAALAALDCLPLADSPFVDVIRAPDPGAPEELRREHRWIMQEGSPCGRFKTDALRKAWVSASWLRDNFAHPLARIRAAFYVGGVLGLEPLSEWIDADPAHLAQFRALAVTAGHVPAQWHDPEYRRRFPDDPNARVALAFHRLKNLRDELAEANVPLLEIRKGRRRVLIPVDATPEEEARLLAKLEK